MAVKSYKPTSDGVRFKTVVDHQNLSPASEKSLLSRINSKAGRNAQGKITVRHRGGGVKRKFRIIDFKRDKDNIPARVVALEYDPNRSANIALISYCDGEKRYIVAPLGLKVDDIIESGEKSDIKIGNCLKLVFIPDGTTIHNIELYPGGGAKLVRSAGSSGQLMAKDGGMAVIRLASGEQRLVSVDCKATIGQVSNVDHHNISIGKAGRARWQGKRPEVRGSVMNPCDHPHGGGEGKSPVGRSGPYTPWGKPVFKKTRNEKKKSSKYIIGKKKG